MIKNKILQAVTMISLGSMALAQTTNATNPLGESMNNFKELFIKVGVPFILALAFLIGIGFGLSLVFDFIKAGQEGGQKPTAKSIILKIIAIVVAVGLGSTVTFFKKSILGDATPDLEIEEIGG